MTGIATASTLALRPGRVAPSLVAGSVAIVAVLLGIPWVALLAGMGLVALAPIARDLAVRAILWTIGSLAATGIVASLSWVPVGPGLVAVLIGLGMLATLLSAAASTGIPWRPRVPWADAVVLLGAALLLLALTAPLLGASPEDVALDLARGFDQLNHFTMLRNILGESSFEWATQDGSAAVAAGYPMGVHALAVLGILAGPGGPSLQPGDALSHFAWVSAIGVALVALVLGWVAVRVARATGPVELADRRALVGAGIWLVFAPLTGSFAGVFEVGHSAFMVPAAVGISASWLAVSAGPRRPRSAMVVLLVAAVALMGSYPPLIAGLAPAAVILVGAQLGLRSRGWVPGLAAVVGILGLLALWRWRASFEFVATASGEFSTPVVTTLMMTAVTLLLVMACQSRGHTAPLRGLSSASGYGAAALVVALLALAVGFAPLQNYYVAKLLQATWWAELPVLVGASAWAVTRLLRDRPDRMRAPALLACAAAIGLVLALVPDGRYLGLGGSAMLTHRIHERERAHGLVQLVAASRIAQPSTDAAAVMGEPGGWFFPVAASDTDPDPAIRTGSLASQWLSSLRGVRSATQDEASLCMTGPADESAIPCLEEWLGRHEQLPLTIIVPDGSDATAFDELASNSPGRVRVVVLPPAEDGSPVGGP